MLHQRRHALIPTTVRESGRVRIALVEGRRYADRGRRFVGCAVTMAARLKKPVWLKLPLNLHVEAAILGMDFGVQLAHTGQYSNSLP